MLSILVDGEKNTFIPSKSNDYIFDETTSKCDNNAIITWDYETWSPIIRKMSTTRTHCSLNFKKGYNETILNGTTPKLKSELIPVTIESDGTVKKADLSSKWYSYEEKRWANAIVLENNEEYYEVGEIIPEDAIESYFVWIPKYRYKLWDLGNYTKLTSYDTSKIHEIPIIFGDYNTTDEKINECETPMLSGVSGDCEVGDYMTHPAFLSIPSTGFWVGKFETGYKNAKESKEAAQNIFDTSKIIIKPNAHSWRYINIANIHLNSYNYKRNMDSHMMKNTEWGAVAYLSHSKYGNPTRVRTNNNSNFLTGYASVTEPTCGMTDTNEECNRYGTSKDVTLPYNTDTGYLASTTGNISGIYDMAGGAQEWVFAIMENESGTELYVGESDTKNNGFNGLYIDDINKNISGIDFPNNKYYDTYQCATNNNEFERRILGDATGELGPFGKVCYSTSTGIERCRYVNSWYLGAAYFVDKRGLVFARGQRYNFGNYSNIFSFDEEWTLNTNDVNLGYRIVLTP